MSLILSFEIRDLNALFHLTTTHPIPFKGRVTWLKESVGMFVSCHKLKLCDIFAQVTI